MKKTSSILALIVIIMTLCFFLSGCYNNNNKTDLDIQSKDRSKFEGVNPIINLDDYKTDDNSLSNFSFEKIFFYIDEKKSIVSEVYEKKDTRSVSILPIDASNGSYIIEIGKKEPGYHYFDDSYDDSDMAKLAIFDVIDSQKSDNQLLIESLFSLSLLNKNAYGVQYEIKNLHKSICIYMVYDGDLYFFDLKDTNNPADITKTQGFEIYMEVFCSLNTN